MTNGLYHADLVDRFNFTYGSSRIWITIMKHCCAIQSVFSVNFLVGEKTLVVQ